ncbi:MAG: glycerophosphodiester phosphodiesterase, partial [Bacteroidaceae bacterium]|nr:glycerophosphodiester phosphodiesterase [Bacteroidaceae bacterium]
MNAPKTRKAGLLLMMALALFMSCSPKKETPVYPTMIAHRGCWLKGLVPENSVEAVRMAKRFGYTGIECDVHYTKDSVMVILHDKTLNRTVRRAADYSKLEQPVKLSDLTFEELRRDYVLESSDPALRTPIPTLEELLSACKEHGILPMLHSSLP